MKAEGIKKKNYQSDNILTRLHHIYMINDHNIARKVWKIQYLCV